MGSNREKSNIAVTILEKLTFLKGNKNISHFDGSNNILVDCRWRYKLIIKKCMKHDFLGEVVATSCAPS